MAKELNDAFHLFGEFLEDKGIWTCYSRQHAVLLLQAFNGEVFFIGLILLWWDIILWFHLLYVAYNLLFSVFVESTDVLNNLFNSQCISDLHQVLHFDFGNNVDASSIELILTLLINFPFYKNQPDIHPGTVWEQLTHFLQPIIHNDFKSGLLDGLIQHNITCFHSSIH